MRDRLIACFRDLLAQISRYDRAELTPGDPGVYSPAGDSTEKFRAGRKNAVPNLFARVSCRVSGKASPCAILLIEELPKEVTQ